MWSLPPCQGVFPTWDYAPSKADLIHSDMLPPDPRHAGTTWQKTRYVEAVYPSRVDYADGTTWTPPENYKRSPRRLRQ